MLVNARARVGEMRIITRIAAIISTFVVTAALGVTSALAQTYPPTVEPTTLRPAKANPAEAEVAFTGLRLSVWMALLAGLVLIGLVTYFVGRRRAARA